MRFAAKAMTTIGILSLGTGCTVVAVTQGGRVSRVAPGILAIKPAEGVGVAAYKSRGLGLVPGRSGLTVGWASEDAVLVFDRTKCAVVIFDQPRNPEAMAFWRKLATERSDICLAGEK